MSKPVIDSYGTKIWYNDKRQVHREDGPAAIFTDGMEQWYQNDKLHRIGGPAIIGPNGIFRWCQNGKTHRLDGPALQYPNGYEAWYIHGIEIDIQSIIAQHELSPDWKSWTEEEFFLVRLSA